LGLFETFKNHALIECPLILGIAFSGLKTRPGLFPICGECESLEIGPSAADESKGRLMKDHCGTSEESTERAPGIASQPEKPSSRWWEYYAVRYAMGVGFGTPLAGLLWHHYHGFFEPALQIPTPFASPLAAVLWAAIGLTFCYVSSVPMLTIHTSRVCLRLEWWGRGRLIALGSVLVLSSLLVYFFVSKWIGCYDSGQRAALELLSLLVLFQAFLILSVLASSGDTVRFYDKLEVERLAHPNFVESYRHMREHGNSVLIVLGELFLTFCLWEIHPDDTTRPGDSMVLVYFGLTIAFWLIPSGLVWMVGTLLERHLAKHN